MSGLITEPHVDGPDDVYQWLIDLHAGRSQAESNRINTRLILILVNHIGDRKAIKYAIDLALREGVTPGNHSDPQMSPDRQ